MKTLLIFLSAFVLLISCTTDNSARYDGKFCSGAGDINYLRLIDESFAFLNPNPVVPNLSMIYEPEWDTFVEGAGWNAWWIQNSYGFSYAATPFLKGTMVLHFAKFLGSLLEQPGRRETNGRSGP